MSETDPKVEPQQDVPAESPKPGPSKPEPEPAPPWGEDFDPEKAWKLIQNLKDDKGKLQDRLKESEPLIAEAEQIRKANLTEAQATQEALEAAQKLAEQSAQTMNQFRDRAVAAEAKALAAELQFADASVGVQLLGSLAEFVDKGGDVDTEKLSAALTELLEKHPYLARGDDGPKRMRPNPAQGTSGAKSTYDAQIQAAQERGDVMQSIALKQQRFYQKP
jgi:hypothetical protein